VVHPHLEHTRRGLRGLSEEELGQLGRALAQAQAQPPFLPDDVLPWDPQALPRPAPSDNVLPAGQAAGLPDDVIPSDLEDLPRPAPSNAALEAALRGGPPRQAAGAGLAVTAPEELELVLAAPAVVPAAAGQPAQAAGAPRGLQEFEEFDLVLAGPAFERVFGPELRRPVQEPGLDPVQVVMVQVGAAALHDLGAALCRAVLHMHSAVMVRVGVAAALHAAVGCGMLCCTCAWLPALLPRLQSCRLHAGHNRKPIWRKGKQLAQLHLPEL
jgi:hypothetical protein